MSGVRQLAAELCRALVAFEPGRYSPADCGELAQELGRAAKACETAAARAAARAAGGAAGDAAERLATATGGSSGRARSAIETIRQVAECPATQDALLSGEVSLEQAHEIVSVPHHEAELLELAARSGSGAVKRQAHKRYQETMDPESLHAARQQAREFVHWEDRLGMVRFRGALPPEIGHRFVNRLDRETDRRWREARRDRRGESREQLTADAFARLVDPARPVKRGGVDIVFVLDLPAWLRGHTHPGEACHILGGGPVPLSVVRAHVTDAFVKAVLHDGTQVETIVHYGRHRPALLQSVLDLGQPPDFSGVECSEEGCHRRYGLEWDHADPVANRGPTSKDNLAARCWPHHHEKTARDRQAGKLRGRQPDEHERGP